MNNLLSSSDVIRLNIWCNNYAGDLRSSFQSGVPYPVKADGSLHGLYSLFEISFAHLCVHRKEYAAALGHLVRSAEAVIRIFEMYEQGLPIHPGHASLGRVTDLVLCHVTRVPHLIELMNSKLRPEYALRDQPGIDQNPEQVYMWRVIRALTLRDLPAAVELVDNPPNKGKKVTRQWVLDWYEGKAPSPASVEKMYPGWFGVVWAIAHQDEARFRNALLIADEKWYKYAKYNWRGTPEAISFLYGAGLVRLAEWAWGRPVEVSTPNIPAELLTSDIQPAAVEKVLPD